jgi:hypothetical protein
LHAYGGETGESLRNLGLFSLSQLVFIGLGIIAYILGKNGETTPPPKSNLTKSNPTKLSPSKR